MLSRLALGKPSLPVGLMGRWVVAVLPRAKLASGRSEALGIPEVASYGTEMATLNPRDDSGPAPDSEERAARLQARRERGASIVEAVSRILLAGSEPDPLTWMRLGGEVGQVDALLAVVLVDPDENIGSPLSFDAAYQQNRARMVELRRLAYDYWPRLVRVVRSPAALELLRVEAASREIRDAAQRQ